MKKRISIYILFILLLIPIKVFAGGYYEETTIYKAKISNMSGTTAYDCNLDKCEIIEDYCYTDDNDETRCSGETKVLPYSSSVTITGEVTRNGVSYVEIFTEEDKTRNKFKTIKDMYNFPHDGIIHPIYVKAEDVSLVDANLNDYKKIEVDFYPLDDSNYLYKGPSTLYGKIDSEYKLEPNKLVKSTYYVGRWYYVTQNNNSGWVYAGYANSYNVGLYYDWSEDDSTLAEKYELKVLTVKDTKLYDSPITKKTIKTIPEKTELISIYKYHSKYNEKENKYGIYYYVKYDNTYGWIRSDENLAYADPGEIKIKDSKLIIYSAYHFKSLDEEVSVNNAKVLYNYHNEFLYIEYNNNEYGWIPVNNEDGFEFTPLENILFKCYEKTDEDKCIDPSGKKYTYYTRDYSVPPSYASDEFNTNNYDKKLYYNDIIEKTYGEEEYEVDEPEPQKSDAITIDVKEENKGIDINKIVIISASGLLAILVIVLIIAIISKRKKKSN